MMAEPSTGELELLKLFWREGPMNAREVQTMAEPELGWAVTTTRTVLERMRNKGLLERSLVHGTVVYAAVRGKLDVVGNMLRRVRMMLEIDGDLPAAAFSGSALLSADDVEALEALINQPDSGDASTGDEV